MRQGDKGENLIMPFLKTKLSDYYMIKILIGLLVTVGFLSIPETALSQNQSANPLERKIDQRDPVIPSGYGKRELSSFEIYRIKKMIAELAQSAQAELQQGNQDQAFELWYRQLKLTRAISAEAEIKALGDIGAIAWQENRGLDLRNIAERLISLEGEISAKKPLSLDLLEKFATAYQQVRYLDQAIEIQTKITKVSRRKDNYNLAVERSNFEVLGKLYLAKFDYQNAAKVYQTLLSLTDEQNPEFPSKNKADLYLRSLINIYDRTGQTNQAITTKQHLIEHYTTTKKLNKIAKLKMAIARDYETLNKIPKAIEAYNLTWKMADQNQQLAIASDALTRLGELHQGRGQVPQAISAYTNLIEIQQQSYNYYGLINTYDTLGKIYLKSNQKIKAKQSFQRALELAQSLNYKVDYFNNQIKQVGE